MEGFGAGRSSDTNQATGGVDLTIRKLTTTMSQLPFKILITGLNKKRSELSVLDSDKLIDGDKFPPTISTSSLVSECSEMRGCRIESMSRGG
ncbi:uncharacterized protein LOC125548910 isoform X2 [Triticum urartu]|uniref:uncharacterized protein LOC125548910 isoform X2 n=1 Tax=Triticum urartu TaxID=4572 RepID=UPI00204363B3|nr:uncharacterized protein LOC125548910 isoform X2 [Triticum urartu]